MGVIPFQQPDKVIMHKDTEFDGVFEFSPLEKGYAVTVGNSLRRILLSSLEGYAITTVKIDGVHHEYSTIKGVVEDVTEIVLNLKQVRFKANSSAEENERAFVSIKGKSQVTAGDIAKFTSAFEILNPDLVICNLEPDVDLDFEITIDKNRGYVPSEENNPTESVIGLIAIDSIHSPILNVQYKVEDFRVGQNTDFEKLIIDLNTDGSIHPEEALKEAANILIQHFILFSDESILLDTQVKKPVEEVDESHLQMQKMLKTSLTDLELSVRAYNCLRAAEIRTLGDLVSYHLEDLLKFRNFGKKSLSELEELVAFKGLNFGMDISKFDLDS